MRSEVDLQKVLEQEKPVYVGRDYTEEIIPLHIEQPTMVQVLEFIDIAQSSGELSPRGKGEKEEKRQNNLLYSAAKATGGWFALGTESSSIALWKVPIFQKFPNFSPNSLFFCQRWRRT